MYSAVGHGEEDHYGVHGPYWQMVNPLHITIPDFENDLSPTNTSALVVDGDAQFYGSMSVLADDNEGDNAHLAVGAVLPPAFRATIPTGSLLLDGDGGGRLYASTSAKVAPIFVHHAACKVPSGQTRGTARVKLPHAYLVGTVGGHASSAGAMPPTALYVESADLGATGGTDEFTLHCEAFVAPQAGTTYIYTAQLVFYHPVLSTVTGA
jgi:hypothetical protein